MHIFLIISFLVPVLIFASLPHILERITGHRPKRTIPLLVACVAYAVSWYVPSPLIHGENTAFTTHFIGGGIFTGLMWLYVKQHLNWKPPVWLELISLYAAVCSLGVANELFELAISELGLVHNFNGLDTWWDLLANTLGTMTFWIGYRIAILKRLK